MKSITLGSGAKLDISVSAFGVSKDLYQAVCEELIHVKIASKDQIANVLKDAACMALCSKRIESCLKECLKKAAYNGRRIDDETWEPIEARQDYLEACFEVAKENLLPFGKNLYAKYSPLWEVLKNSLA